MDKLTFEQRFWAKVNKDGPVPEHRPELGPCWIWTAAGGAYGLFLGPNGYGCAHRIAYEMFVEQIPDGLTIDHLCKTTRCVNPAHMEAVTAAVNALRGDGPFAVNARKTHCIHGHEFAPEDTSRDTRGRRVCKACKRETTRAIRARRKVAA